MLHKLEIKTDTFKKYESMKTLIFTATYNEKENIRTLCEEIHSLYPGFDILVVDDNSPDGTSEIVEDLCQKIPCLKIIKRHSKLGLGTAHQLAMLYALENGYDQLVTMDADLSHAPADIGRLLDGLQNADFVIGSRYMSGGQCDYTGYRKHISRLANIAARLLLGIPLHEFTTSFRAFRVDFLKNLNYAKLQTRGYSFFMESIFRLVQIQARIIEVPIVFRDRFGGESKIPKYEIYRSMYKLLTLVALRFLRNPGIVNALPTGEKCQFCGSLYQIELYADNTLLEGNEAAAYKCTSLEHSSNPRVLKCLACDLVQVPPSAQKDNLDGLYESVEDIQYLENTASRQRTFAEAYRRIQPYVGESPGKLMEVGAYCGLFIKEVQNYGWECEGIEPSSWAVNYAKEKYGIHLLNGTLSDNVEQVASDYDLVVSWDVLEHVRDPVQFLTEANQILKPDGHICISTLDFNNWLPQFAGKRWPWLMDMHLFYFTPDVLKQMFEKAGFEVIYTGRYVHYVTLRYLFKKLSAIPVFGLNRIISIFVPLMPKSILLPISFGDIKLFVARKRMPKLAVRRDAEYVEHGEALKVKL